jgi:hypothetical protein
VTTLPGSSQRGKKETRVPLLVFTLSSLLGAVSAQLEHGFLGQLHGNRVPGNSVRRVVSGEKKEKCNLALWVLIKVIRHLCQGAAPFRPGKEEVGLADGSQGPEKRVTWLRSGQLWVCGFSALLAVSLWRA